MNIEGWGSCREPLVHLHLRPGQQGEFRIYPYNQDLLKLPPGLNNQILHDGGIGDKLEAQGFHAPGPILGTSDDHHLTDHLVIVQMDFYLILQLHGCKLETV